MTIIKASGMWCVVMVDIFFSSYNNNNKNKLMMYPKKSRRTIIFKREWLCNVCKICVFYLFFYVDDDCWFFCSIFRSEFSKGKEKFNFKRLKLLIKKFSVRVFWFFLLFFLLFIEKNRDNLRNLWIHIFKYICLENYLIEIEEFDRTK